MNEMALCDEVPILDTTAARELFVRIVAALSSRVVEERIDGAIARAKARVPEAHYDAKRAPPLAPERVGALSPWRKPGALDLREIEPIDTALPEEWIAPPILAPDDYAREVAVDAFAAAGVFDDFDAFDAAAAFHTIEEAVASYAAWLLPARPMSHGHVDDEGAPRARRGEWGAWHWHPVRLRDRLATWALADETQRWTMIRKAATAMLRARHVDLGDAWIEAIDPAENTKPRPGQRRRSPLTLLVGAGLTVNGYVTADGVGRVLTRRELSWLGLATGMVRPESCSTPDEVFARALDATETALRRAGVPAVHPGRRAPIRAYTSQHGDVVRVFPPSEECPRKSFAMGRRRSRPEARSPSPFLGTSRSLDAIREEAARD